MHISFQKIKIIDGFYDFLFISAQLGFTWVLIHSCQTITIIKPLWFISFFSLMTDIHLKTLLSAHFIFGMLLHLISFKKAKQRKLCRHLQTLCCIIIHLLIDISKNDIVLCSYKLYFFPCIFSTNLIITDGGETEKVLRTWPLGGAVV